jgi:CheY-like chemotaxis protein
MNTLPLIWIVDDDELFIMITRNNIRKALFEVHVETFQDGLESIDCLKERIASGGELPNIILLDLNMPVSDGWFFLSKYSKLDESIRSQISVFICTSSIDPKDMHRAQELKDVKGFREKPLSTESINEIIG